jgi:hypothetical protein
VTISGSGWVPNEDMQASLCGANAVDGDIDCQASTSLIMSPGSAGTLSYQLQVTVPPKPCPCVVLVTSLRDNTQIKLPVQVAGAPMAPVRSIAPASLPPSVRVVSIRITGGSWPSGWFGGPVSHNLVVTFYNSGPSPILYPVISAAWGRTGQTDNVINSPTLTMIQPNETRRITMPFRFDPLSFGNYEISGRLTGPAQPVAFETETSNWPIGLMLIAFLLLVGLVTWLLLRRRSRRRASREEESPGDAQGEPTEDEAETDRLTPVSAEAAGDGASAPPGVFGNQVGSTAGQAAQSATAESSPGEQHGVATGGDQAGADGSNQDVTTRSSG